MIIDSVSSIFGQIKVPGDKSISHRAVMFGALAKGTTVIENFLESADCLSTIRCFSNLGISVENEHKKGHVLVHGNGLNGLHAPANSLDVGNSGTTMRLIAGILCGQPFDSILTGDASIVRRPMNRIIQPLTQMGGNINSQLENGCAPLLIKKTNSSLHGICYHSPVASAQVKSCILLAGMYAEGKTSVIEPYISRNHTELMLRQFGAEITCENTTVTITPNPILTACKIQVPGDISSAAYFIAAAAILPNSELVIEEVGVNPTRDGILKVCEKMGVNYQLEEVNQEGGEVFCNIRVHSSKMHGCVIEGEMIPTLIDELPVIAVMACFAEGETIIRDAKELKVKESNRIDAVVNFLSEMGADISATEDGMKIVGGSSLHGITMQSQKDHRIAMSAAVAGLAAKGSTNILDADCVTISYPSFFQDLSRLCH